MKISIAISLLILVLAGLFRWQSAARLSAVEKTHRQLVSEAAALGIFLDTENPEADVLVTKRTREGRAEKDAQAVAAARKMIAFALYMEELKETGEEGGEEMQERIVELMDLMLAMDSGQLKTLITELRSNTEMEAESRNGMIAFAIMTLANDHPQAAIAIFTETRDLLEDGMIGTHVLSSSLAKWASTDPDGALKWVRENGKKDPDLITDNVKAGLVNGAASKDMALAFDLISELEMESPSQALSGIARSLRTEEERTKYLELVRNLPKKEGEEGGVNVLHYLADGIAKDGFENGSKWLETSNLTAKELQDIAGSIGNNVKNGENGKWLGWMGENLTGDKRDSIVRNSMQNWTKSDYRAAGKWLAAEPDGPTKYSAVKGYSQAVAQYDPQTATQWAMTLPEGKMRNETLQQIYYAWPKDTPEQKAERETFKQQHGFD